MGPPTVSDYIFFAALFVLIAIMIMLAVQGRVHFVF